MNYNKSNDSHTVLWRKDFGSNGKGKRRTAEDLLDFGWRAEKLARLSSVLCKLLTVLSSNRRYHISSI